MFDTQYPKNSHRCTVCIWNTGFLLWMKSEYLSFAVNFRILRATIDCLQTSRLTERRACVNGCHYLWCTSATPFLIVPCSVHSQWSLDYLLMLTCGALSQLNIPVSLKITPCLRKPRKIHSKVWRVRYISAKPGWPAFWGSSVGWRVLCIGT